MVAMPSLRPRPGLSKEPHRCSKMAVEPLSFHSAPAQNMDLLCPVPFPLSQCSVSPPRLWAVGYCQYSTALFSFSPLGWWSHFIIVRRMSRPGRTPKPRTTEPLKRRARSKGVVPFSRPYPLTPHRIDGIGDRSSQDNPPPPPLGSQKKGRRLRSFRSSAFRCL
jgi:hypothetical protein